MKATAPFMGLVPAMPSWNDPLFNSTRAGTCWEVYNIKERGECASPPTSPAPPSPQTESAAAGKPEDGVEPVVNLRKVCRLTLVGCAVPPDGMNVTVTVTDETEKDVGWFTKWDVGEKPDCPYSPSFTLDDQVTEDGAEQVEDGREAKEDQSGMRRSTGKRF